MPAYDVNSYRSLFPYLQTGLLYFDHAATSPFSTRVRDAMKQYLERKTEKDLNLFHDVLKMMAETRQQLAGLLNCPSERIALIDSTSNGLNVLAGGLDWKTGDRILLADIEFPANIVPFLNQRRHGVEIDFVKNRDGRILLEDLERKITPRTRLLSISHVQFLHGFRSDLAAIGRLCRQKGVIFCVDAIQSAGAVPIDVEEMQIDFLSCGCQKWLMGPEGTAFIFVSEETQQRISQASVGWTSNRNFFGDFFNYRIDLDPSARRYENGTLNFIGLFGLRASLGILREVGIANIEEHLLQLGDYVIERLRSLNVEIISPTEPSSRAGIVTFRPQNAQAMFDKLKANSITVSLREDCIRFSPHFYNTREELATALEIAFGD